MQIDGYLDFLGRSALFNNATTAGLIINFAIVDEMYNNLVYSCALERIHVTWPFEIGAR